MLAVRRGAGCGGAGEVRAKLASVAPNMATTPRTQAQQARPGRPLRPRPPRSACWNQDPHVLAGDGLVGLGVDSPVERAVEDFGRGSAGRRDRPVGSGAKRRPDAGRPGDHPSGAGHERFDAGLAKGEVGRLTEKLGDVHVDDEAAWRRWSRTGTTTWRAVRRSVGDRVTDGEGQAGVRGTTGGRASDAQERRQSGEVPGGVVDAYLRAKRGPVMSTFLGALGSPGHRPATAGRAGEGQKRDAAEVMTRRASFHACCSWRTVAFAVAVSRPSRARPSTSARATSDLPKSSWPRGLTSAATRTTAAVRTEHAGWPGSPARGAHRFRGAHRRCAPASLAIGPESQSSPRTSTTREPT